MKMSKGGREREREGENRFKKERGFGKEKE